MIYEIDRTGKAYGLSSRQALAGALRRAGYTETVDGLSMAELKRLAKAQHLIRFCFSAAEAEAVTRHNRENMKVRTLDEMIEAQ